MLKKDLKYRVKRAYRLCRIGWAVFLCGVGLQQAAGQALPFVHYTPDNDYNPLPSAEVFKVYQSRTGYLWMAVYSSGLVRYDGRAYEIYDLDDGLRDLDILNMVEDGLGHLWVASNAGLVVSEEPLEAYAGGRRVRFIQSIGETPLLNAAVNRNAIAVDDQGAVWAGTLGSGIVRYRLSDSGLVDIDTLHTSLDGEPENRTVHALLSSRDGSVWASLSQGDVLIYPEPTTTDFDRIAPDSTVGGAHINVMYEDAGQRVWAGTSEGQLLGWLPDDAPRRFALIDGSIGGYVAGLMVSQDDVLWVASEGAPIARFQLPSLERQPDISIENGLLSLNQHHIMEDREGNLWISQSGGVSKLRFNYQAFSYLTGERYPTKPPLLPSKAVPAVIEARDQAAGCRLWVGTLEGGIACVREDYSSVVIDESMGLRGNEVDAIVTDRSGRLWVGTAYGINGVALPTSTRPLPPAAESRIIRIGDADARLSGYRGTSIYSILDHPIPVSEGSDSRVESVWFAGYRSVYGLVDDAWYVFRAPTGLPATGYYALAFDEDGRLWVGTLDEGLYRSVDPMTIAALESMAHDPVPFQLGDGGGHFGVEVKSVLFEPVWSKTTEAPTNYIESLLWHNGVMWAGTPRGLFALEGSPPTVTTHLTNRDGLRSENVISMSLWPETGIIWLGTNGGLVAFDPEQRQVTNTVTKQDGLLDNEAWYYNSVRTSADGIVYYGSPNGLTLYDPHRDRRSETPPLIALNSVTYEEDARGNNDINIDYAGLSFANEGLVKFKTRLEGYDAAWSPEKSDAKIRYTNLPAYWRARTYTFELLAGNASGAWTTEPLRYAFKVSPAWWLQWWAFFAYLGLLGMGIVAIDRYQRGRLIRLERERAEIEKERLRAEAAELQARVLQADYKRQKLELEKARELEEAYHHLKATQAQLIQAEKLASLGKLTAGIAHEIKNPLNFVTNFAAMSNEYVQELRAYFEKHRKNPLDKAEEDLEDVLQGLQISAEKIQHHGGRVDHIVQSMLDHSRTAPAERRLVRVNEFLEEYVTHAYHMLIASDPDSLLDIEREFDPEAGQIEMNPQEIARTLLNLLNNAFYAVGQKQAEVGAAYRPRVAVRTIKRGNQLEIQVADNGVGIPAETATRIFEPFFTTRPAGSGTGLGLSLGYDIVTQGHSGELRVESAEGEGATFFIVLPYE